MDIDVNLPDWMAGRANEPLDEELVSLPRTVATKLHGFTDEEWDGILDGSWEITPEIAQKLLNLTGIGVPFWLAFEQNFRAGLSAGKHWFGRPEEGKT